METPSSIRMLTRSQTSSQNGKKDDSFSRSRPNGNPERSALLDITNDSPIVGLATEKTPSSSAVKNGVRTMKNTPGSGEALLRGQVKTLLQKVEEEAEFVNSKLSSGDRPPFRVVLGLPGPLPAQLLAPTPANTPQIIIEQDGLKVAPIQVAEAVKPEEEECLINRALLFDSPEKSDVTDVSSSLSYQGSEIRSYPEKSPDDDSSSAWSLQVNVSIQDDEDEEEEEEIGDLEAEEEEEEDYEDAEEYADESFDDLCEGLSKMTVGDKFEGKHTRFVYNSDGEIEGEEVIGEKKNASPSKVVLKGLPAPEGKHLRFHEDQE